MSPHHNRSRLGSRAPASAKRNKHGQSKGSRSAPNRRHRRQTSEFRIDLRQEEFPSGSRRHSPRKAKRPEQTTPSVSGIAMNLALRPSHAGSASVDLPRSKRNKANASASSPVQNDEAESRLLKKRDWTVSHVGPQQNGLVPVEWAPTLIPERLICEDHEQQLYFADADDNHYYIDSRRVEGIDSHGRTTYKVRWRDGLISLEQLNSIKATILDAPERRASVFNDRHPPSSPPGNDQALGRDITLTATPMPSIEGSDRQTRAPSALSGLAKVAPPIEPIDDLRFKPERDDVEYEIHSGIWNALLRKTEARFLGHDRRVLKCLAKWMNSRQRAPIRPIMIKTAYIQGGHRFNGRDPTKAAAVLVHRIGRQVKRQCRRCKDGKGIFQECVVEDGYGKGSCTNCSGTDHGRSCEFNENPKNAAEKCDPEFSDSESESEQHGTRSVTPLERAPSLHQPAAQEAAQSAANVRRKTKSSSRAPGPLDTPRWNAVNIPKPTRPLLRLPMHSPAPSVSSSTSARDFVFSPRNPPSSQTSMGAHAYLMSGGLGPSDDLAVKEPSKSSKVPDSGRKRRKDKRAANRSQAAEFGPLSTPLSPLPVPSTAQALITPVRPYICEPISLGSSSSSSADSVTAVCRRIKLHRSASHLPPQRRKHRSAMEGFVPYGYRFGPGEMTRQQYNYILRHLEKRNIRLLESVHGEYVRDSLLMKMPLPRDEVDFFAHHGLEFFQKEVMIHLPKPIEVL